MDFKWTDRVDGVDPNSANDINIIAHAVETLNEEIKSLPSGGGGSTSGNVPTKLSELEADSISRSDQEPFDFSVYIADFNAHEMNFGVDNLTFRNMGYGSGVNFDGNVIHGVGTPEADTDGANKKYVDDAVNGIPSWAKQPTKPTYTAAEVGAIAKNQGSANVGKILVVGSDGNLVLVDMPVMGDVIGYIDENNNIIVQGDLSDGTYSVKYEMEDGTKVDIGNLVIDSNVYYSVTNNLTNCTSNNGATQVVEGESYSATITANSGYELKSVSVTMGGSAVSVSGGVINIAIVTGDIIITAVAEEAAVTPSYTNVLPLSVDSNGDDYKGTNGEDGFNTNKKISVSSGNESTASACVSGFIKLPEGEQSEIRIKNITLSASASINNFVFYNASKEKISGYYSGAGTAGSFHSDVSVTDGVYLFPTEQWFPNDNIPVYFRFSCGEITDKTIVTINEEIV